MRDRKQEAFGFDDSADFPFADVMGPPRLSSVATAVDVALASKWGGWSLLDGSSL